MVNAKMIAVTGVCSIIVAGVLFSTLSDQTGTSSASGAGTPLSELRSACGTIQPEAEGNCDPIELCNDVIDRLEEAGATTSADVIACSAVVPEYNGSLTDNFVFEEAVNLAQASSGGLHEAVDLLCEEGSAAEVPKGRLRRLTGKLQEKMAQIAGQQSLSLSTAAEEREMFLVYNVFRGYGCCSTSAFMAMGVGDQNKCNDEGSPRGENKWSRKQKKKKTMAWKTKLSKCCLQHDLVLTGGDSCSADGNADVSLYQCSRGKKMCKGSWGTSWSQCCGASSLIKMAMKDAPNGCK